MNRSILPSMPGNEADRLRAQFDVARTDLLVAEEELATEQAAVNAFRMHCRLKIGVLAERAAELRTEKQRLLTRLQLLRQAEELGIPYDEEDPFWQGREPEWEPEPQVYVDDLPFPTDTPRDKYAERRLYRQLAQRFHPDKALGSGEAAYRTALMASINSAYARGDVEALRDFAEEMDPTLYVELGIDETREMRRLRRNLLTIRQRRRRLLQELRALREENTARLWRRAQELEAEGRSWWEEVRLELLAEIEAGEETIASLHRELARYNTL